MKPETKKVQQLEEKEIGFALLEMDEEVGEFDGEPLNDIPIWAWYSACHSEIQEAEEERKMQELEDAIEIKEMMMMGQIEPDSIPTSWAMSFCDF